jgi:hypothetical protein
VAVAFSLFVSEVDVTDSTMITRSEASADDRSEVPVAVS